MPNRSFEIAIRYLYTVFSVSRGKTPPIKEAAMIMMVHGKLITLRVGSMRRTPCDPDCRPSADRGNIRSSQGGPRALPAEQRRDVAGFFVHGQVPRLGQFPQLRVEEVRDLARRPHGHDEIAVARDDEEPELEEPKPPAGVPASTNAVTAPS